MAKEDQAQGQESSQPGALFFVIFVRDAHAHLTVSTESIQCTSARGFGPLGGWGGGCCRGPCGAHVASERHSCGIRMYQAI